MKSLIIPVPTASWIPPESELPCVLNTGIIVRHGAEWTNWEESAIDGAPPAFHHACQRLLQSFSGRASGVLIWGTTGEGIGMWPFQHLVLLSAMKQACPPDITLYAGVLGGDKMVGDQVNSAQSLGIDNIVLGLNHTWNNIVRFQTAISALGTSWRLFLYNLPTFRPADRDFILACLEDPRVVGFKDSSGDAEFFSWLLSLKKERPGFQVFQGNESAYGELSGEEFESVDGLVSGNANVHPALLGAYMDNPRHHVHRTARAELHEYIAWLSWRSNATPAASIEQHIHGLKRRLVWLCISPYHPEVTILSPGQESLYSTRSGSLFQTHQR